MAIGTDLIGIFGSMLVSVGYFTLFIFMGLIFLPAYFWGVKYKTTVTIRERVGNHTTTYHTKGGLVKNRGRGRMEFRILKNKINPFQFWEFPVLSDKFYHQTKRGKKFLEFYKAGELSTDLKPIPPLDPSTLNILPTDIKIFDWTMQGFEKDARETRVATDKFAKFAIIGVPVIMMAALTMSFIIGMGTAEELQQGNVQVANQLAGWGDRVVRVEEAKAGVQRIEAAQGDVSEANNFLEKVGVDLG